MLFNSLLMMYLCRDSLRHQVSVPQINGPPTICSRIQDSSGSWISLRELKAKFMPTTPIASLFRHLRTWEVITRRANAEERQYLAQHGSNLKNAGRILLVESQSLCKYLHRTARSGQLQSRLLSFSGLPSQGTPATHSEPAQPAAMSCSGMQFWISAFASPVCCKP